MDYKLEDNVRQFLEGATKYCGKAAEEEFSQEMFGNCFDMGIESPIERIMWIAVHTVCRVNRIQINADLMLFKGKEVPGLGLHFSPQFKLEKYRADFFAWHQMFGKEPQNWIVECDGHEFHERTKAERQREKQRDRFFTVRGYKILRFTGSEIVRNPYEVAVEIIKAVTNDICVVTPHEFFGG